VNLEGRIEISIRGGNSGPEVNITSSRLLTVSRHFRGLPAEETVRKVPLLYAACRAAQGAAAAGAFEDALGIAPVAETRRVRDLLIHAETVREHALRVMMDWPGFIAGNPGAPPAGAIKMLMQLSSDLSRALDGGGGAMHIDGRCKPDWGAAGRTLAQLQSFVESLIFGEELNIWRARCTQNDLTIWAGQACTDAQRLAHHLLTAEHWQAGTCTISPLPHADRALLTARLFGENAEHFVAAPDWDGTACETTPLARHLEYPLVRAACSPLGYGIGARLIACLAGISQSLLRMRTLAEGGTMDAAIQSDADGTGLAQIEAARGRLVHAVRLDARKTGAYRILAPTEWNFHPHGAAAQGLAEIARHGGADQERLARLFVMAVDPCVAAGVTFCQ
jgi:coenzyme F420-reducing hydrogenase alpha subunit